MAPSAYADEAAALQVPTCSSSTCANRFDVATKVFESDNRPATADARMREIWRLVPVCAGEAIGVGTGVVQGPKRAGEPISDEIKRLVGETHRLGDIGSMTPKERRLGLAKHRKFNGANAKVRPTGRGTFLNCTVTAWSPQFGSGYVRTGGEVTCSTLRSLYLEVETYRYDPSNGSHTEINSAAGGNGGTTSYVTKWTSWAACYDPYSYWGSAYGQIQGQPQYWSSDSTSTFASPNDKCF